MATLIGDVFTDSPSRFHNHNMIRTSTIQHHNSHHFHQNPPITRPHEQDVVDSQSRSTPRPTVNASRQGSTPIVGRRDWEDSPIPTANPEKREKQPPLPRSLAGTSGGGGGREGGAARLPSPPSSSSSSSETPSGAIPTDDGTHDNSASSSSASSTSTATTVVPPHTKTIPSPASDSEPRWALDAAHPTMDISTLGDGPSSPIQTQKTIHVRDLAHIQALAKTEILNGAGSSSINDPPLQQMKYEISAMPINDIIEMVAALLTKITTTNDLQHDALNRNAHHLRQAQAQSQSQEGKENMSPLSSSVLAFHGKNVPSISILSYLSRIHKYCPTTYEVFLSLLVYFDRMTERVNDMVLKSEEARRLQPQQQNVPDEDTVMDDYDDDDDDTQSDETDEDLADTDEEVATKGDGRRKGKKKKKKEEEPNVLGGAAQATYFVVDSYNIHRLIIAGVTCSSKFFSDVFYTNSRYAKVGGLPLAELNHLELQFLLLNDFRLAVAVEDLEAYATMLVEFYAREVVVPKAGGQ